jgi:hypothetical protein
MALVSDLIHAIEQVGLHGCQHLARDLRADFAGGDEVPKRVNLAQILGEGGEHPGVVIRHRRLPLQRSAISMPTIVSSKIANMQARKAIPQSRTRYEGVISVAPVFGAPSRSFAVMCGKWAVGHGAVRAVL